MIAFERRDIASLEKSLKQRRDELLQEVQDVTGRDEDEPFRKLAGEVAASGDESAASALIYTDHAAVDRDLGEIRAIDRALERITSSLYGRCTECGDQIPQERLHANPIAERYFPYQDHFEKTHSHENWLLL